MPSFFYLAMSWIGEITSLPARIGRFWSVQRAVQKGRKRK